MFSVENLGRTHGPIESIYDVLQYAWDTLCQEYDVTAGLPNLQAIFQGVQLDNSEQAARIIIANLIMEITESVHRFSPWYRLPARSFGLISFRDPQTHCIKWSLAPEAEQKWHNLIESLTSEIEHKNGLIEAIILVDNFDNKAPGSEESVLTKCDCIPPKELLIKQAYLDETQIICSACQHPFLPLAN
jgi:hypothetical protein